MIVLLLFLIPLAGGILCFSIEGNRAVRHWSLLISVIALGVALGGCINNGEKGLEFHAAWMGNLGSSFSLKLDGLSKILALLTALAFPLIFLATYNNKYKKAQNFFGLMLLAEAGLIGVFTATDALLFYFFWELALIPVYFLSSIWGGEKRVTATFKFFIYTFAGSVLMLVALIFCSYHTPDHSYALSSFYKVSLTASEQNWVFWLLFLAFAIKMPIFPFHTWQPDTYEQAPTSVTMVLSGVMVKMGVFGLIRWVLPVVPFAAYAHGDTVSILSVIGIIYASVIAIRQDDLKRLVAYSSIAHVGIMSVTIFSESYIGFQGVLLQMFNHGINIIGLWIVVEWIERRFKTRRISDLGGIASSSPGLAILLVIVALANISLPLTNAFVGEFLMFTGIFTSSITKYHITFTVLAALSIILGAVYILTMIQRVFFGPARELSASGGSLEIHEWFSLALVVLLIVAIGIFPQPLLQMTASFSKALSGQIDINKLLRQ